MAKKIEEKVAPGTIKLKFIRNTPYNGVDYGPDYETDVADVESRQATIWIEKGRAVEVKAKAKPEADSETEKA